MEIEHLEESALDEHSEDSIMGHQDDSVEVYHVNGYSSLATFLSSDRDKSTTIYRRFDNLSARNLLILQSELMELEALQEKYDTEDRSLSTNEKASMRNWAILEREAKEFDNARAKERIRLTLEIRAKIKEYS